MALACERHWPCARLIQNGGLIYANCADLPSDAAMHDGWVGTREAMPQPFQLRLGSPAAKMATSYQFTLTWLCYHWIKSYDYSHKMSTYSPNNDVFIDQIRPFIHIYFRRTVDLILFKSCLSRGIISIRKNILRKHKQFGGYSHENRINPIRCQMF